MVLWKYPKRKGRNSAVGYIEVVKCNNLQVGFRTLFGKGKI